MHRGGMLIGYIVIFLLVVLITLVLTIGLKNRGELREIRDHLAAERQRREELREQVAGKHRAPHLSLVRKLPPTLAVAGAVIWELARQHRAASVGVASVGAGLMTSALVLAPPVGDPPADAVQPTTTPHSVVHTHHGQPTGSPATSPGSVKHPSPRLTAPVKRSTSAAVHPSPAAGVTPTPSASGSIPPESTPTPTGPLAPVTSAVASVTSAAPSLLPTDPPITSVLPSVCAKLPIGHKHCI